MVLPHPFFECGRKYYNLQAGPQITVKMEQPITNLKYVEEHLKCPHYLTGDQVSLGLYHLKAGQSLTRRHLSRPVLFFVLSGLLSVTSSRQEARFRAGQMFLLPKADVFYGRADAECELLRLSIARGFTLCNQFSFAHLAQCAEEAGSGEPPDAVGRPESFGCVLPIVRPLELELRATAEALRQRLMCSHYQCAKANILFNLLRCFYTTDELARLFRPLLRADADFKERVLRTCGDAKSVKEMIVQLNMPPSTFNRRFHDAFGMSASQWLTEQKKNGILSAVVMSRQSFAEIADRYGLTPNYLTLFCREHFGATPSQLRAIYPGSARAADLAALTGMVIPMPPPEEAFGSDEADAAAFDDPRRDGDG